MLAMEMETGTDSAQARSVDPLDFCDVNTDPDFDCFPMPCIEGLLDCLGASLLLDIVFANSKEKKHLSLHQTVYTILSLTVWDCLGRCLLH